MGRDSIFDIEFPQNDKIRSLLNLKRLNEVFINTRVFEKSASLAAADFDINSKIKYKIKSNDTYYTTWQKLCTYFISYLLGPAKFLERSDADELVCLPIVTKLEVNGSLQTIRAINIYNSTKRIGTLFFKDPEFNNEFSFYGQNEFSSYGSWASKVRADVQNYNLYGLNKPLTSDIASSDSTAMKSMLMESVSTVSNTITIRDIFSKIEKLKKINNGMN